MFKKCNVTIITMIATTITATKIIHNNDNNSIFPHRVSVVVSRVHYWQFECWISLSCCIMYEIYSTKGVAFVQFWRLYCDSVVRPKQPKNTLKYVHPKTVCCIVKLKCRVWCTSRVYSGRDSELKWILFVLIYSHFPLRQASYHNFG